ncbi:MULTISPECIES: metal ABC transporter solute-binding protein, Zn/Mn family [Pandoraea]|jgi:zinc/manganese transport system substrate-binding protein|uniref:Manganese-binding lipoprotein MntA n=1 Tax=Pandoraea pnomenusa TaxID=93220 RepID=A0A378YKR9_9BURK|nr:MULTISPECIES: zinc ABC transporter substrate-binding protein [Pandoraea]MBN9093373.1 zinc ABC transporter substrate-binding protein [Pandoraea pnomenusa]QDH61387.1 metal ABC transporter substrate-binding protein [Pandoraea pnomenusa]QDX23365.1 metal ABC transporter substrate-binding protein [Pandoraea pnomenusa]SUA77766.1 Pneumococcal surface adhesin A [Pandoraea pnomenusa]VVE69577.1 Manganese-binding lipoprotein MntA [Pandoraea pnomenusa]
MFGLGKTGGKSWLGAGFFAAMVALALSLASPARAQDTRLPVGASFSILADIVKVVGGDRVDVTTLVGPDQDTHVYEPTPADVAKISGTKLFFVNGLGFEGWLPRLMKSSHYPGTLVTVTKGLKPRTMVDEGHTVSDPHMFQDPERVKTMVDNIAAALSQADPAGATYYADRARNYRGALDDLITWANKQLAPIAASRRVVLTSHDAFGYLGQRFGIRFLAPEGVSTESEASARDVANLIRVIRRTGIKAVFMENISNPRLVQRIARDARVTVDGKLYSDALSQNPEASTYLQLFQHNIRALAAAMKDNR